MVPSEISYYFGFNPRFCEKRDRLTEFRGSRFQWGDLYNIDGKAVSFHVRISRFKLKFEFRLIPQSHHS